LIKLNVFVKVRQTIENKLHWNLDNFVRADLALKRMKKSSKGSDLVSKPGLSIIEAKK
jgi:hypothetical protein